MTKTINSWQNVKLENIVDNLDNKRIPVTKDKRSKGNIPYYGATGIVDYVDDYIFDEELLLVGEDGADWSPFANTAYIVNGKSWVNNHAHVLRVTKANIGFLMEFLNYADLTIHTSGTTRGKLNKSDLMNFQVPLPDRSIQDRIYLLLASLNEQIIKTDQVIQKTEDLKQGLMNELLTKGIGHKKFKNTKLGEIPEEWKFCSILDSDIKIIDGDRGVNYPNQHEFYPEGFCLFLSNRNIRNDSFDFSEPIFISQEKDQQLRKGKLNRWDVVLTTRGTVGNVAIYDDLITYDHIRINSGMLIFRVGKSISPEFLYYLLKSPLFKERYIQLGSGSAQPQLPISSLRNLLIPIPPQEEQLKIINQLKMLDMKYSSENKQRANLIELKKGLMQDIFNQKVQIV